MTREQKLIAVVKVLNTYERAINFFLIMFDRNRYERHVTQHGLGSTFFIFGYDIKKFHELSGSTNMTRREIIKMLKYYIENQNQ